MATPGRFVTLEGAEGAGKSTQSGLLAERLRQAGRHVTATREPGGTPGAERLRALILSGDVPFSPLAETMLHVAARVDHVATVIRPALQAGGWVVCDRFADSTRAYQGFGQGVDPQAIASLAALVGLVPDLTLILDGAPETTRQRLAARGQAADRYERLGDTFFANVRAGFRHIAAAEPGRCVMVDADGPIQAVSARVWEIVTERLAP